MLTLSEFSDREILARVNDTIKEYGVATSELVARQMGFNRDKQVAGVGVRLGWMRRFGVIDKVEKSSPTKWLVTPFGEAMLDSKINPTLQRTVSGFAGPQMVRLIQDVVNQRYLVADDTQAHMLRRAWQHGAAQRTGRG